MVFRRQVARLAHVCKKAKRAKQLSLVKCHKFFSAKSASTSRCPSRFIVGIKDKGKTTGFLCSHSRFFSLSISLLLRLSSHPNISERIYRITGKMIDGWHFIPRSLHYNTFLHHVRRKPGSQNDRKNKFSKEFARFFKNWKRTYFSAHRDCITHFIIFFLCSW